MKKRRGAHHRHAAEYGNGISHFDLALAAFSVDYLRRQGHGAHVTAALHGIPEHERHEVHDKLKSRVATYQRRAGMSRVLWLEVRETLTELGYSLHVHLLCVFPNVEWRDKFVASVNGSKAYRRLGESAVLAVAIVTAEHWDKFPSYFTQETTMQAWFSAKKSFPKPQGPFPFDGDRVIASRAVEDAAVRSGRFESWRRTNVSRKPKPAPAAAAAAPKAISAPEPPKLTVVASNEVVAEPVQLSFFAEVTRLEHYTGGVMTCAVAEQIRFHQKRLGLSDDALAAALGISRPQLVNARQRRFGLSLQPALRLRQVLLGAGERIAA